MEIKGNPQPGNTVKIHLATLADGTIVVREVEVLNVSGIATQETQDDQSQDSGNTGEGQDDQSSEDQGQSNPDDNSDDNSGDD